METESVRSGFSELSSRSRASRSQPSNCYSNQAGNGPNNSNVNKGSHGHHGRIRHHSHHSHRTNRSERSFISTLLPKNDSINIAMDDQGERGDIIEVQILPQDDNWGDNTTAVTGTSDRSVSEDDVSRIAMDSSLGWMFRCQRHMGSIVAVVLSGFAFVSPIVMVVLPKLNFLDWNEEQLTCGPQCDGMLISFAFKLLILLIGCWALFFRQPTATMPRIFIFRAFILALVFVFTFSYWLFYGVRVLEKKDDVTFENVIVFAISLVDALLFIHYLAVVLIIVRQLQPQYFVKVVRSPDGESHCYTVGQLSIQRAAVWVLEHYYCDFTIYNPYLERLPVRTRKPMSGFKFYDVDAVANDNPGHAQSRAMMTAHARRRDSSHNERFYEEHEYERRVRKRRARLVTAAEEAFTHVKRMHEENGSAIPLDPNEAAQAIFPSLARALQKYLRITRQQPWHSMESILQHLATCLSHDATPKAFLEKYLIMSPVLQSDREIQRSIQTWALVCDTLLSRPIADGTMFQLRQNDVSLLCFIHRLPHFNVVEEIINPKANKFVLRLNSETSV